jgi:hypothetical protein
MTDRLLIAYGLMLLIALGLGAAAWWNLYHSRTRSLARQRKRESASSSARTGSSDA